MRRLLIVWTLLLPLAVAAPLSAQTTRATATGSGARPNILLVIGDDFGVDVTSSMYPGLIEGLVERYGPGGLGHPGFQSIVGKPASTPVLDELAREGMRFSSVWAHPFCSPTRAAIITGLFAASTRIKNYQDPLAQRHDTFVRRLKDAGYRTAIFGKWHLAGLGRYPGMKPREAGFDLFRGNLNAAIGTFWSYDYQVQDAGTPAGEWRNETAPERSLPGIAPTTYAPVVKVADTLEWIRAREAEAPGEPWLAWVAFNLSHATARRAPSQMAVPNADTLDGPSRREMEACGGEFGTQNTGTCSGEALMRAMTNSMDTLLGTLLEGVDALDPNTYVIYISDNGTPMYGRPGLDHIDNMYITRTGRGKGTVYESGARVPLAIRGPGITPGSESAAYAHAVDLYATILSLARLDVPARVSDADGGGTIPLDSRSLAPVLFDGAMEVRDADRGYVLTETEDLMRGGIREVGARNARYKVLCTNNAGMGSCTFYDVARDPLEEFPLTVPSSCDGYASGAWAPADEAWHYCRLTEVVATESFLEVREAANPGER